MSRLSRSQSFNDSEEVLDKDKHEALTLDGTEKVDFRDEEAEEDEGLCGYGMSGLGEKKRRLRVDQVQALEIDFQVENKLDPDRKQRLAQDLGLQPRQVAVWFQNRRARRKTKQIERDFVALRTRHDALKLDCDALRRDNEALESLIRELEAELRNKTGEEERPHAIYKEGSPESDSSVVFNGEATLHEHCLTECRTQTEDKSGDDKGGCLDEELVGGRSSAAARSFFIQQPAQDLHCYCSDDWD